MPKMRVVWEIEIDAETPLEAAKEAQRWMRTEDWQFYVQIEHNDKVFSVDLGEEDDDAVLPVKVYEPLINQKDV